MSQEEYTAEIRRILAQLSTYDSVKDLGVTNDLDLTELERMRSKHIELQVELERLTWGSLV